MQNPLLTSHKHSASHPNRRCRIAFFAQIAAMVAVMIASRDSSAQAPKKPVVEEKTLITGDRVELKITYFKSNSGPDAPVVVCLHGKRGTRLQWKGLASELQTKGDFAVVTVDLRGHGQSVLGQKKADLKKSDYQNMATFDMEAVRDFLIEEHQKKQLNIDKLGIVACDFSASVALVYTEIDWEKEPYDDSPTPALRTPRGRDVRALALISPDISTPGLIPTKAAGAIRNYPIAIMIGASEKEKNGNDLDRSKKLYEQFASKKEKVENLYFEKYPEDVRGMDLILQNQTLRGHIAAFLDKHVKQFQSEWRDRRSRLERE